VQALSTMRDLYLRNMNRASPVPFVFLLGYSSDLASLCFPRWIRVSGCSFRLVGRVGLCSLGDGGRFLEEEALEVTSADTNQVNEGTGR
jgi:hypothetical protein